MTEDELRANYEGFLLATRSMRERLIRAGQIMPRPDDPEEQIWHAEWKSKQPRNAIREA